MISCECGNNEYPLVSAVITTHNRPDCLKLAVQSVLDQTYKNIEIIVVDDNSDQCTLDYLNGLSRTLSGFTHIHITEEESRGGNYARNKGIRSARGRYIAFLDDDDVWLPEKTAEQIRLFNKDTGLVYCGNYNRYIDGRHKPWAKEVHVDNEYIGDLTKKCFRRICCTTSAMMAEASVIEQTGGFDEKLGFWQETDLFIRICQITQVAAVNKPLVIVRMDLSDPHRLSNKYSGWIEAVDYINDKYKELISGLPEQYKKDRRLLILRDMSVRCEQSGMEEEKRRVLMETWRLSHDIKDLIKLVLNKAVIRIRSPWGISLPDQ